MEREKLEREIYQLTQIIAANAYALVSKSTPVADRAALNAERVAQDRAVRGSGRTDHRSLPFSN
jgi:hypothetical protein